MIPNPIHKVLSTFQNCGVRALLMGGQACVFYGAAEFSRDTDFALHADAANLERLNTAMRELQASVIAVPPLSLEHLQRGHVVHFRCQHPAAAGNTFLASDGEDVSTTDLLRRLGKALGKPARLLPLPHGLLMAALSAIGQRNVVQRLCSSLQVDIAPTRTLLGWAPPVSLDEGLRRTAQAFLAEAR